MVARNFELPADKLAAFCRKWKITEFAVFGSVLRDDFAPDSDVDCLVVFSPESAWTLLDVVGAEEELSELIGRPVDLVERQTVERSENWIRREHILNTAQILYAG
jgi:uncharacterized protein